MLFSHFLSVVLPDALVALVVAGVSFLIAQGVKEVLAVFHVDLSGPAAALTAAVVAVFVAFANGLLAQIPPEMEPLAEAILRIIVILLGTVGPFGIFRVYRGLKSSGAKG